jgi:ABC-type glycerol-3-phosphate transport system substrate-binding protein
MVMRGKWVAVLALTAMLAGCGTGAAPPTARTDFVVQPVPQKDGTACELNGTTAVSSTCSSYGASTGEITPMGVAS